MKKHLEKKNINYIMKEYLGCESDYILENLDFTHQVIDIVYKIIDIYGKVDKNIQYIFQCDYEEGRAHDNYNDIEVLDNINGIVVYEIKERTE